MHSKIPCNNEYCNCGLKVVKEQPEVLANWIKLKLLTFKKSLGFRTKHQFQLLLTVKKMHLIFPSKTL